MEYIQDELIEEIDGLFGEEIGEPTRKRTFSDTNGRTRRRANINVTLTVVCVDHRYNVTATNALSCKF